MNYGDFFQIVLLSIIGCESAVTCLPPSLSNSAGILPRAVALLILSFLILFLMSYTASVLMKSTAVLEVFLSELSSSGTKNISQKFDFPMCPDSNIGILLISPYYFRELTGINCYINFYCYLIWKSPSFCLISFRQICLRLSKVSKKCLRGKFILRCYTIYYVAMLN